MSELQCVGVLVCGSFGVWEFWCLGVAECESWGVLIQTIKKMHIFDICKFKTMLSLSSAGALRCECFVVWMHCSVGVLPHGGFASMVGLQCGESRCERL